MPVLFRDRVVPVTYVRYTKEVASLPCREIICRGEIAKMPVVLRAIQLMTEQLMSPDIVSC